MKQRHTPFDPGTQASRLQETIELFDLANAMAWDMGGRITFWNRGAEEFYGWTKEEVLGAAALELLRTVFPKPLDSIRETLFRAGSWAGKLSQIRKDGSRVSVTSN